ncbi:MAG TPA: condensation domain-containing protein, partial [Ktedonobacteraceae bacterium]|nr:condensation domain-containing protein [Ktedonobacteraceae bacterium]
MSDALLSNNNLSLEEKRRLLVQFSQKYKEVSRFRPLSPAQQRMWFMDQLVQESPLYNMPVALRLSGTLDIEALQRSLNEIVKRHEALRVTFSMHDGLPRQIVAPVVHIPLPIHDLSNLLEHEPARSLQQLLDQEVRQPFDLTQGPLLRARLYRLAHNEQVLLLVLHHIVADGWSLGVFFHELEELYRAYQQGQPSPLSALSLQYGDYARWLRQPAQQAQQEKHLAYWRQQLAGAPMTLSLPADHLRPAQQRYQGATLSFQIPVSLSQALSAFSRQEGCTLYQTLLAAFEVLLYRYTNQEDFLVGTSVAGRTRTELEPLIGLFANMLVMRAKCENEPSFRTLLGRVRQTALEAYAHQDVPFEKLVEMLQPPRDTGYAPLVQVMFALQNAPASPPGMSGLAVHLEELTTRTSKFDLSLDLLETEQGLQGSLEYASDLFEQGSMRRLIGQYQRVLEGIVADAQRSIAHLPLLTEEEERQLLVQWNETGSRY